MHVCLCVGAEQKAPKEGKQYRWGAPYTVQLRVLLQRTLKTRRFEALSSRDFLQFLIVGVLAGALHNQITSWSFLDVVLFRWVR